MKETTWQCPYCPCQFSTNIDLNHHLNAFSHEKKLHQQNWQTTIQHRYEHSKKTKPHKPTKHKPHHPQYNATLPVVHFVNTLPPQKSTVIQS